MFMKALLRLLVLVLILGAPSSFAQTMTPTPSSADLDGNGSIDSEDLILFLRSWKETQNPASTSTPTDTVVVVDTETPIETNTPSDTGTATETPTDTPANLAPYIISVPPEEARVGDPYSHHVEAVDPEGEGIIFSLPIAPSGMVISATGFIDWVPSKVGSASVEVEISDGVHAVTEAWIVGVNLWTTAASANVAALLGATVEVTDASSPVFGAQVIIPPGSLSEDSAVQILSVSTDYFAGPEIFVHLGGLLGVTGEVEFQVPLSSEIYDSSPEGQFALFVHDASTGMWFRITDTDFKLNTSKGVKHAAGWVVGKLKGGYRVYADAVVGGLNLYADGVQTVGKTIGGVLYEAYNVVDEAQRVVTSFYSQPEGFIPLKGSFENFWSGPAGRRNLLIIHGIASNAMYFRGADDVGISLLNCYDNILFWQYRSCRPIGSQPDLLERKFWTRSGDYLWKQFAYRYKTRVLQSMAMEGFKGKSGVNTGIRFPALKDLSWNFHCDIIAHSMGGLVARAMLEDSPDMAPGTRVDAFVDNLVTLGTPHGGALKELFVDYFDFFFKAIAKNIPGIEDVLTFLETTGPGTIDLIDNYYPTPVHPISQDFVDYLEETALRSRHTKYWQIGGNSGGHLGDDGWVDAPSALYPIPEAPPDNQLLIEGPDGAHSRLHEAFKSNGALPWVIEKLSLVDCHCPARIECLRVGNNLPCNDQPVMSAIILNADGATNPNVSFPAAKLSVLNANGTSVQNAEISLSFSESTVETNTCSAGQLVTANHRFSPNANMLAYQLRGNGIPYTAPTGQAYYKIELIVNDPSNPTFQCLATGRKVIPVTVSLPGCAPVSDNIAMSYSSSIITQGLKGHQPPN
jgi:hypothetical protein